MQKLTQKLTTLRSMFFDRKISLGKIVKYFAGQFLAYVGIGRFIPFSAKNYRLYLSPSPVAMVLFRDPWVDRDEEVAAKHILSPGDNVIDIGANVGTFSIVSAKMVAPHGGVIAIEAHPRTAAYAKRNLELNHISNCKLINLALGDSEGSIGFSNDIYDDVNHVDLKSSLIVPLRPLDEIEEIQTFQSIRLIKLDVEGYELFVLRGGVKTFGRARAVLFEACEKNCVPFGYSVKDLFEWFTLNGFTIVYPGTGIVAAYEDLDENVLYNLLAVKG